MSEDNIIRITVGDVDVDLCPTEQIAIRQNLLGHIALSPKFQEVLANVNNTFPGSKVIEIRKLNKKEG